jgi:hypothetical protein
VDNHIYIFGGGRNPTGMDGSEIIEEVFVSRIPFLRTEGVLTQPVSGSVLFGIDTGAVMAGGRTGTADAVTDCDALELPGTISSDEAIPFNLDNAIAAATPMNTARQFAAGAAGNGKAYVFGGFDAAGTPLNSIEEYDPSAGTWTTLAAVITPARGGCGAAVLDGRIYIMGGDTGGAKSTVVEVFDPASGLVTTGLASLTPGRSHFGCGAEANSKKIYVFGGEDAAGDPMATTSIYNTLTNAWTAGPAMPVALEGVLCLYEGGYLKLFGGEQPWPPAAPTATVLSDRVWRYDHENKLFYLEDIVLPLGLRDLAGCRVIHTWSHRGVNQTDEFCIIGGGSDGTGYRDEIYRFWTR